MGVASAQIVHAAGESSPGQLPDGTFAIVLAARDEDHLRTIACRLVDADLVFHEIKEPDAPWDGQLMAIGLRPIQRSVGRRFLSNLPLYRGPVSAGAPERGGSKPAPAPFGGVAQ
jgi:hypothetical protein